MLCIFPLEPKVEINLHYSTNNAHNRVGNLILDKI